MFQYAVKVVRDHLADNLDGIRVATEVPAVRPAQLVTITSVPAGSSDKPEHLAWRRLIVHCWDTTEFNTATLSEQVRELLLSIRHTGVGVRKVVFVGEPGKYNDPDDDAPRFQMTVDLLMRASHN